MKNLLLTLIFGFGALMNTHLSAEDTILDKTTGKAFPASVSFTNEGTNYNLEATGVSTRTKFFVKVYSVAHYLQNLGDVNSKNIFNQIFNDDKAKQLTLIWVRDVDSRTIKDGYMDTFKKVFSHEQQKELSGQIDQFLGFFNENAKINDKQVIRWIPGGIIEVEINGVKKGQVKSVDFAKAVWGIWLGAKSVVPRNQLVSRVK